MSCSLNIPAVTRDVAEETELVGVCLRIHSLNRQDELTEHSFMADKIMPLSDALEGYELFNSMKVQKVVFEAQK
jgi:hypothetical protein